VDLLPRLDDAARRPQLHRANNRQTSYISDEEQKRPHLMSPLRWSRDSGPASRNRCAMCPRIKRDDRCPVGVDEFAHLSDDRV
jgi:hypothetical protein